MGEQLKRPYEISIWEDELVTPQSGNSYYKENKIAVIGTDTSTGLNMVKKPVLGKKTNGEKTLTFSLRYKYYDPYNEAKEIINPFAAYLVNERKVKLYYEGEWYDFIIKDHSESSDGLEWTYSCVDANVLELSKTGYNLEFSSELGNNQGTAEELTEQVIKDTEWQLKKPVNIGKQLVEEPIYTGVLESVTGIDLVNASKDGVDVPGAGTEVYIFYSYVANKDGKYVQFIEKKNDSQYVIDDKNNIVDTNFRINTDLTFEDGEFKLNGTTILTVGEIDIRYHAYRVVYNHLTTYDPVMQRIVKRYQIDNGQEIYNFTDYVQTSSSILTNYITNGENFNIFEDGSIQGWDADTKSHSSHWTKIDLVTEPEIKSESALVDLEALNQVEGFLKVDFQGKGDIDTTISGQTYDVIYNSGIDDNASIIEKIAKGDQFLFRYRVGFGTPHGTSVSGPDGGPSPDVRLHLWIAKYTTENCTYDNVTKVVKSIDLDNIIMKAEGVYDKQLNNIITGGELISNNTLYVIDDIVQSPSTKYIYKVEDEEYVWDPAQSKYVEKEEDCSNYLPYFYTVGTAEKAVTKQELEDPTNHYGIFIFYTGGNEAAGTPKACYIQDIQLTRYIEDPKTKEPLTIGNVPSANPVEKNYYYLKPKEGTAEEEVQLYTSLEALVGDIKSNTSITTDSIKPLYNDNADKILTIEESKSNCFNILQSIAETFECWINLEVSHTENGEIELDSNNRPKKYISLNEYAGKDNWTGFKYGINLKSIERTVNSDEIVTKLIVEQTQSDYVDDGFVSISKAKSNPTGEEYILNFDYYYKQGLLDKEQCEEDINSFTSAVRVYNDSIKELNKRKIDLENIVLSLGSKRNVFSELIKQAQENKNKKLDEFYELVHMSYEEYSSTTHEITPTDSKLTEEQNLLSIIGEIYTYSAAINNYSGILTNLNNEYNARKKELKGDPTYYITISVIEDDNEQRQVVISVSDYDAQVTFTIDGSDYTNSLSQNYFVIDSNAQQLIIKNWNSGYNLVTDEATYIGDATLAINDNKVAKYKLEPVSSTDKGLIGQIEEQTNLKKELVKNFTNKYIRFIQEGTWSENKYIDSDLYYLNALQVSNTSVQPKVTYNIGVVDVSLIEGLEFYDFDVGDKSYIEDTEFFGWSTVDGILTPAREEVIVSEVEWHLDEPENNNIVVQNFKTQFEDLFQRISAAVQTVQYNEATYAKISSILDANGTINQNALISSLNKIAGSEYYLTSDGSVKIQGNQITVQDLTNSANCVIINNEGIKISSDGGKTYTTAIDGQGVNLDAVISSFINTNKIIIGSSTNPSFRWDKSGISAYKVGNNEVFDLKTFVRYDQYGLYGIKDNPTFIAHSLQDVKNKAHFAVTWDGFFIKNSYTGGGQVEITSDNDFRVLKSGGTEKIKIGALEWTQDGTVTTTPIPGVAPSKYGIRIKNDSGTDVFTTGDDGNITITGTIYATDGSFSGTVYADAGEIGGMVVNNDKLVMDTIVLEPGVGIYSTVTTGVRRMFEISDVDGSAIFRNIEALGGKISNLNVIDNLVVGAQSAAGLIKSFNYIPNTLGWAIKSDGTAEFNDVTARGTIYANSGTLGQLSVVNTITVGNDGAIQSANFSAENDTGWRINNTNAIFNSAVIRGTIYANAGEIGGMTVDNSKLTMDTIALEPGVGIYSTVRNNSNEKLFEISDVDGSAVFRNITATGGLIQDLYVANVLTVGHGNVTGLIKSQNYVPLTTGWAILSDGTADFNNVIARGTIYATDGELGALTVKDTITVGQYGAIESANYSASDGWHIDNNGAIFNNASIRGTITAETGDFLGDVYVGDRTTERHIRISGGYDAQTSSFGALPTIKSGNYADGANYGWMIDGNGDAVFNNITVRGAIKTVVFEYEEIQAVGGAFLFRPSSTIRYAAVEGNDLIIEVEKPLIFTVGNWCKISNYNSQNAGVVNLSSFGLIYIYKIKEKRTVVTPGQNDVIYLVLEDATEILEELEIEAEELIGGSLIDFGKDSSDIGYNNGFYNYGIGVNSSDNYVNLPRRAISLFKTVVDPEASPKVTYDYQGILGTLPNLSASKAGTIYSNYMAGTQGIYTDNMYIGDSDHYIAFYTDNNNEKKLKVKANTVVFEVDQQGNEITIDDKIEEIENDPARQAIQVIIDSSAGNMFLGHNISATLTCTVLRGGTEDITNQVTRFTWTKKDKDGNIDSSWSRLAAGRTITITPADVASKAIFTCEVEF